MADITQILCEIEQGDPTAAEQLLPLVYGEVRRVTDALVVVPTLYALFYRITSSST